MPANLTPVYRAAEQRYRAARSLPERVAALQEMLAVIPKHKGTEHLRADLRTRLSKALEEMEAPPLTKKGAVSPWSIRKEGAGRATLFGLPNGGKSALLATLTGAAAKVGAYPFTTDVPLPGTLKVGGARIQLIDTPPLAPHHAEPALFGVLRTSDVLIPVLDLTDEPVERYRYLQSELALRHLTFAVPGEEAEEGWDAKHTVIAATKADIPGALDALPALQEAARGLMMVPVSVDEEFGLEELGEAVFTALDVIRVFTKAPGHEPDRDDPVVLPTGSTVFDFAEALHRGWEKHLKFGVLWGGSGKFAAQRVGRDHVLADGDALELHV
jgi:uncharacterized protein